MTYPHDQDDEDRVLDALIVMALWNYPIGDGLPLDLAPPPLDGPDPILSPEDQQALDILGPDFIDRIMAGIPRHRSSSRLKQ